MLFWFVVCGSEHPLVSGEVDSRPRSRSASRGRGGAGAAGELWVGLGAGSDDLGGVAGLPPGESGGKLARLGGVQGVSASPPSSA